MRVILWIIFLILFTWAFLGLKKSSDQDRIEKENNIQNVIDSLQNVIDSLNKPSNVWEDLYPGAIYPPGKKDILYDTIFQRSIGDTVLIPIDTILSAIMFIESSYNDSAYRASEDAVGCLQIRKCMVDDVNRILKRQKSTLRFTYNSRWSRDSSIQMFEIYCNHYNLITAEEIARCWNGGPRGINNPATVGYWEKVKNKINS